jgi:hypothetical protein
LHPRQPDRRDLAYYVPERVQEAFSVENASTIVHCMGKAMTRLHTNVLPSAFPRASHVSPLERDAGVKQSGSSPYAHNQGGSYSEVNPGRVKATQSERTSCHLSGDDAGGENYRELGKAEPIN